MKNNKPKKHIKESIFATVLGGMRELAESDPIPGASSQEFAVGDPVIITGDVQFQGKTGDVREIGRDGAFVVVDLYNYGPYSFHASDVSYNDYADSDEEDERAQGVAEAGNKPVDWQFPLGTGDTRTARELKTQMRDASDEFVKGAAKTTGPMHSRVAKMQSKLAQSELRRREQGVAEGSPKDPNAPKKVQDRKTGKWYDPKKEFDKKISSPEVRSQMKRMAQEEAEQIDELSKDTLTSYRDQTKEKRKAYNDAIRHVGMSGGDDKRVADWSKEHDRLGGKIKIANRKIKNKDNAGVSEGSESLESLRAQAKLISDKIDSVVMSGGRVGLDDPLSKQLKAIHNKINQAKKSMGEAFGNPGAGSTGTSRGNKRIAATVRKQLAAPSQDSAPASELGDQAFAKTHKHRVGVTYSDPNHTAVSQRKETVYKIIRIPAVYQGQTVYQGEAEELAKKYYKKQGYRVHGVEYVGMVSTNANQPSAKQAQNVPEDADERDAVIVNRMSWPEIVNQINSAMKATGWKGRRKDDDSYMFSTKGGLEDEWYIVTIENRGDNIFTYALGTVEEGEPHIGEQESLPMTAASVSELMIAVREGFGMADTNEGVLDGAGESDSPVAGAIIRRILMQRTDLLAKYGPEKVGAAVDEVADFVGDVDEIGSSDVSGWIRHVEQMLGNMTEQGVAEGVEIVDQDSDLDQQVFTLNVDGETVSFTYWDYENNFQNPDIKDIYQQAREQLGKKLSPEQIKAVARSVFKSFKSGVAEGLPQTLRKIVPGYAKREIDKKMDAQKFGRTDVDKDANYYRYKKIQDKLKGQGVAEGRATYGPITDAHKAAAKKAFAAGERDGKAGAEKNKQYMSSALMKTTYLNGYKQGKQGVAEDSKEKTQGIALSKAYKKDFDDKKPGQDRKETALTSTYSKTGKPGGELKKQGVAEGSNAKTIKPITPAAKRYHEKHKWLLNANIPGAAGEHYDMIQKLNQQGVTETEIDEKAKSKAQQKFMGMVYAAKQGEKPASPEVAKVAKGISKKAAKDYASTKHKGKPEHVKEAGIDEARMSAAVKLQRAWERQRAKSDASLARTPSSIPKKPEPKQVAEAYGDVIFKVDGWTYQAQEDREEDNIKLFHDAISPDGKRYPIDFNPYHEMTPETFGLWIKLGMPGRTGRGPLDNDQILSMAKSSGLTESAQGARSKQLGTGQWFQQVVADFKTRDQGK